MRFARPRSRRMSIELNVTSFIDIIFNLLVFFILSTSFATGASKNGLVVDLPAASSKDSSVAERDLVIAMTADGAVVVRNRAVTVEELPALLRDWHEANPTGLVVVQADAEVAHGKVVAVIDQVKALKIPRVVIAAQGD